jgi:WD40 repeat protein
MRLLETKNWHVIAASNHEDEPISAAGFSPDNRFFAAVSEPFDGDGLLRIWDLSGPKEKEPIAFEGWPRALAFAADSSLLVAGTTNADSVEISRVFRIEDGEHVNDVSGGPVIAMSPSGRLLATGTARASLGLQRSREAARYGLSEWEGP